MTDSLTSISNSFGVRSIELRGIKTQGAAYNTIQCVDGNCTCKYDYDATRKHKVYKVCTWKPFRAASDWLHKEHSVAWPDRFDEIVANVYNREKNQCAGAHTDQSRLLGERSDIVSVSLGAAGVFYWRPNPDGELRGGDQAIQSLCIDMPPNRKQVYGGLAPCSQEI